MATKRDTRNYSRERDLVPSVARYLRNRTFSRQLEEVPFFEYRMDMYGYSRRNDLTVAVELKIHKWTRAVEQALLYQLCSDLVYIAMPSKTMTAVELTVLDEHGLGLLSVEAHRCRQVLSARPSSVLRKHYRKQYLALVCEEP